MTKNACILGFGVLLLATSGTSEARGQDRAGDGSDQDRVAEVVELNRRLLQQQIVERDPDLFNRIALDQFVVVAPGGRIENKAQSAAGVSAFDARGIELSDEQVVFSPGVAVLVGRLAIDGVMRPVGALPPMKFMAVFVEDAGGWRLLSRSLTPCFPIAIENGFC